MKTKTKRVCEAEQLSLDRISTLPQPIIETILCRLRTKEAARTSILSREWRYKWTTIPNLELSHHKRYVSVSKQTSSIASTRADMDMRCKFCYDLHQILTHHQGPIHELILGLPEDDCSELDQIIFHLSRNDTVKKLSLWGEDLNFRWYKLPIYVFSFHHLTELNLSYVDLEHLPIFDGFGSLQSLYLWNVGISTKPRLHLLSNCPSLKILSLASTHLNIRSYVRDFLNLPEFNDVLQDDVCNTDHDDFCTINELFKCLPVIEHLTLWLHVSVSLLLDAVPQALPTSLIHLKYFCFEQIVRVDGYGLGFLLVLLKCSPNLEKIKLVCDSDEDFNKKYSVVWEEYSDVWLEHLNELEIGCFSNSKREMEFVKFILARSPKLKKVSIFSIVDQDQESEMLKTLLQAPRASPVVITVT